MTTTDPMEQITAADRMAAADLLDEISTLLDHNGIGQVADLIRVGEFDEHEATIAFARFRRQAEAAERARIVAWLEREAERYHEDGLTYGAAVYAGMIEAGEYRK